MIAEGRKRPELNLADYKNSYHFILSILTHMWPEGFNINDALANSGNKSEKESIYLRVAEVQKIKDTGATFNKVYLRGCSAAGTPAISNVNIAQEFSILFPDTSVTGSTTSTSAYETGYSKPIDNGKWITYVNGKQIN